MSYASSHSGMDFDFEKMQKPTSRNLPEIIKMTSKSFLFLFQLFPGTASETNFQCEISRPSSCRPGLVGGFPCCFHLLCVWNLHLIIAHIIYVVTELLQVCRPRSRLDGVDVQQSLRQTLRGERPGPGFNRCERGCRCCKCPVQRFGEQQDRSVQGPRFESVSRQQLRCEG